MRSLVFVGILVALAGCSKPYIGTSFEALPKHEHKGESVEHEGGESATAPEMPEVTPGNVRTASAFPISAQPTGKPPVAEHVNEYAEAKAEKGHE